MCGIAGQASVGITGNASADATRLGAALDPRRGPIAAPPLSLSSNGAAVSHGGMAGFMRRMWRGRSAQA